MSITIYLYLFMIYSILGWMMESTKGVIEQKKFVNRGFMIGPYCPIYGVGSVAITIFLQKYISFPIAVFCITVMMCGILEYFTSYILEKLFKARWWDYKNRKYNINGRICLETIIPFGIFGCLILYLLNPFFVEILNKFDIAVLNIVISCIMVIFAIDFIVSFIVIYNVRKTASTVNKKHTSDNTEEINKKVIFILKNSNIFNRRLIEAFPRVNFADVKKIIVEKTEIVKENVVKVTEDATEKIKSTADSVRNTTIKAKENVVQNISKIKDTTSQNMTKIKENAVQNMEEIKQNTTQNIEKVKENVNTNISKVKEGITKSKNH